MTKYNHCAVKPIQVGRHIHWLAQVSFPGSNNWIGSTAHVNVDLALKEAREIVKQEYGVEEPDNSVESAVQERDEDQARETAAQERDERVQARQAPAPAPQHQMVNSHQQSAIPYYNIVNPVDVQHNYVGVVRRPTSRGSLWCASICIDQQQYFGKHWFGTPLEAAKDYDTIARHYGRDRVNFNEQGLRTTHNKFSRKGVVKKSITKARPVQKTVKSVTDATREWVGKVQYDNIKLGGYMIWPRYNRIFLRIKVWVDGIYKSPIIGKFESEEALHQHYQTYFKQYESVGGPSQEPVLQLPSMQELQAGLV